MARETKLASQGDVNAMVCMGELYRAGLGVTRDANKQFYWQSAAANKGSDAGKLGVASDYALGAGVPKDPKKGIAVIQAMAAKGYVPAWTTMGSFYASGTGLPQDWKQSLAWYAKAAEAGDAYAQTQLALAYRLGRHVKPDPEQAQMWLTKAAQHEFSCAEDYALVAYYIIYGNVNPDSFDKNEIHATLLIKYRYEGGKAEDARVVMSSGDERADDAWLTATQKSRFPSWPEHFESTDKTVGIGAGGAEETFDPDFMSAVQGAVHAAQTIPKDVLLNGSKGTGLAEVAFDYLHGRVSNQKLVSSSKDASEDTEALAAVARAKYPPPPQGYTHVKIPVKIMLKFEQVDP